MRVCEAERGERGLDRVGALARELGYLVGGNVDHIGVIAQARRSSCQPRAPPSSRLLPALPVRILARALPVASMSAVPVRVRFSRLAVEQREVDGGLHQVDAAGKGFRDGIAYIVDHIGVIAGPAIHGVGSGTAVNDVGQAIARQRIRMGRARDVLEVLDRIALGIAACSKARRQRP